MRLGYRFAQPRPPLPRFRKTADTRLYRGQPKSGASHFHAYATCYVVRKGHRFTIALTPV